MNTKAGTLLFGGLLGLAVTWTGIHLFSGRSPGKGFDRDTGPALEAPGAKELHRLLYQLKRSWHPRDRERLLARAKERLPVIEPFLGAFLEVSRKEYCRLALDLVGRLPVPSALPKVQELAKEPAFRADALLAAEGIRPWGPEDLEGFLSEGRMDVLLAALKMARGRKDRPYEAIIPLLDRSQTEIQEAVLDCIARDLPQAALRMLMRRARSAQGPARHLALRALGRARIDGESEAMLVEHLRDPDPETRKQALRSLAGKGGALGDPDAIWDLVLSVESDLQVRALALLCLERTGSFDTRKVLEERHFLHPYLKYFAARCLVKEGRKEGVEMLLHLLDAENAEFYGVEPGRVEDLRYSIRRLLTKLSHIRYSQGREAFVAWFDRLTYFRPHELSPPPPGFMN